MNEVEKTIRRLERELIEAILRRDSDFLKQILADDLITITPHGAVFDKNSMANIGENSDLVNESIETDEIRVKIYENTAVVTGRAVIKSHFKEQDLSGKYRFTRVYVRAADLWQIVSYQATRIAE